MLKENKSKSRSRIKKAKTIASKVRASKNVFSIINMPEDTDASPHWLYWLLIIVFIALVVSVIWSEFSSTSSIQTYIHGL